MREALNTTPRRTLSNTELLRRCLAERDVARPLTVTLPAPVAASVTALWDEASDAVLFAPSHGDSIAGLGTAYAIGGQGLHRFTELRDAARHHFALEVTRSHPDAALADSVFIGGLAFAPCARPHEEAAGGNPRSTNVWAASTDASAAIVRFGDGRFVRPRWTYRIHAGRRTATLQLALPSSELRVPRPSVVSEQAILGELQRIERRLRHPLSAGERVVQRGLREEPEEWFEDRVRAIQERIARGEAQKIVAARCVEARFASSASARPVLERLAERHRGCTRFAMRLDGVTFLGATPERLVRLAGGRVETEALAGTAPPGDEAALVASVKDAAEHAFVVRAIEEALAPFIVGNDVARSPAPVIKALSDVVHLHTPFSGQLREPVHLLDIAAALHPTPAVGGVPRAVALEHIRAHEPSRGWYAGPFGVFDARGEGELVVAIRSGLLHGSRAWAWAGGGIVRDSVPRAELEETRLKLRPVLGALTRA